MEFKLGLQKNSVHLTQALNFLAEKVGFKNSPLFGENSSLKHSSLFGKISNFKILLKNATLFVLNSSLKNSPLLDENSNVKNSSFKGEFIFLKFKFTRIKNDSKH
ncbi:hypothetical protein [Campylobacter troglodytis]|uniref:hypothetical protein n=1 Tax=Campylobacter troglodytis TaxID=654363 RepID=UPI0011597BCD|nr:hypothetical protein [Campylobacter troglodytis]TQR60229.1 hypothetical protein DMC01_06585 [Campylobacter troglodytis]